MSESKQIEEIFSQAMQLQDHAERRTYVELACGGNAQLVQEVSSLLKAARESEDFLESPVIRCESAKASSQPTVRGGAASSNSHSEFPFLTAPFVSDDLGSLGPYRILNCVGRGGMGIVFRGFDLKLQRVVAIKVLSPEIAVDPMARKRFEREARSASAVSHPHCVIIHAVDEEHQPPYMVMEFIQGKSLAEKIAAQGALSVREILRIGAQIAEGLAAAHKQGLVHRDVKPANVLLENGVERAKVADFGLAKVMDDGSMTRTGDLSGTPQFMSPEQASGGRIDHRTDLFSLGAVLYTMCTGRPPFRADNALAVLKRICEDAPRPIGQINPEVPAWLSAIVDRLLAKSPADRFQSASEVAVLLQQHLAMVQAGPNMARPAVETESRSAWYLRLWPWSVLAFGLLAWLALNAAHNFSLFKVGVSESLPQSSESTRTKIGGSGPKPLPLGGASTGRQAGLRSSEENAPPDTVAGTNSGDHRGPTDSIRAGSITPTKEIVDSVGMKMVLIPEGEFDMGSPNWDRDAETGEKPKHKVKITKPFYLGKHEVTQALWRKVMGTDPWKIGGDFYKEGAEYPATHVNWNDAMAFCEKLSRSERKTYRLPTEAEWEYACRGGTTTRFHFGDDENGFERYGWLGQEEKNAQPVALKQANPFGLHDMHGNVWEWCQDWYDQNYYLTSPTSDPQGPAAGSQRVLRGGGWDGMKRGCRSANRAWNPEYLRRFCFGFRVVLVPAVDTSTPAKTSSAASQPHSSPLSE